MLTASICHFFEENIICFTFVPLPVVCAHDKRITCDEEFSDSDDETDNRKHQENFGRSRKRLRRDSGDKKEEDKFEKG